MSEFGDLSKDVQSAPGPMDLATMPADRWDRGAALAIAVLSAIVLTALLPIVDQQWAAAPAFIPAYQAATAVNELVTAALLFGQFRELRRFSLLLLGGGYLYTACLVVVHTLSFPGLFGAGSLVGGPQTTVWLWLAWHVPFPIVVTGYGVLAGRQRDTPLARGGASVAAAVLLPLTLASGVVLLATAGHGSLPALLDDNRYIPKVTRGALSLPLVLSVLALAVLATRTRLRSALDLWLTVAMGAWVVEILLSAVLNSGRFQAGFYVGRLYGLLASCAVLVSLLLATASLHGRLARALGRERDAARTALDESQVRYRALFESIDAGFCVIELAFDKAGVAADYRFVEVNPAFLRQTGLADAPGRWMRAMAPTHEQRWFDLYGRVALTGEPARFEEYAAALGRWFDVHAFRAGEPTSHRVAVLFNDITARRQAEEALSASEAELRRLNEKLELRVAEEVSAREVAQAQLAQAQRMEALGQLAGGVAHDINNVLQAVQGGARLIERRPGDPSQVQRLARMVAEAANRGAAVTRRLLSFSRRADLRAEPVDAADLLAGMREILVHTLGAGIEVRVQVTPGLPPLLADKAQLETVLVNLATNARDAMDGAGAITLSAAVERDPAAGGVAAGRYIRVSVSDTGVGMDAATLARAAEPFFTTKGLGKGTGLGLAMARGFAEQSGGVLHIESAPGAGTTIRLWFPAAAELVADGVPEAGHRSDGGSLVRVLLVDDEALVREITAEGLQDAGYAVLSAGSGVEALELLDASEAVDLLVSDLSMPGMDGLALIKDAQRRRPGLPSILLTGFATDAAELAMGGAIRGSFSLLQKPVEARALAERVAVLVEGRKVTSNGA